MNIKKNELLKLINSQSDTSDFEIQISSASNIINPSMNYYATLSAEDIENFVSSVKINISFLKTLKQ